ncbi:MAG: transposase [Thermodesulfobacteriota bacterium]
MAASNEFGPARCRPYWESELTIYRRKLPHWRLLGAVYFVTWRLAKRQPPLTAEERGAVVTAIKHFEDQRYALPVYVVMDDHVHVLVSPLDGFELHHIVHTWKSFSSKSLVRDWGRTSPVWHREYFDRVVRNDTEFMQKTQYILANPFKRWPSVQEYPWAGFGACL